MPTKEKKINIRKPIVIYVVLMLISIAFILVGFNLSSFSGDKSNEEFYQVKVLAIESISEDEISLGADEDSVVNYRVLFKGEFLKGKYKKHEITMLQYIDNMYPVPVRRVEEGDKILATYSQDPGGSENVWLFVDFNKIGKLKLLCLFFLILILAISGKKGISTILALIFTTATIMFVYIPAILDGRNIYISTGVISVYIIVMSLIFMNGLNKKTMCAIFGNIGGVAVAGILALIVNKSMGITGVLDEDSLFLTYVPGGASIDLRAIVWGSILIGALGAVMDVAMSVASAMKEISEVMEKKSPSKLFRAGMNVGQDAIGTMTNTLILAYIGGAMVTVLLLVATNKNLLFLFNMEMILVEILQGIIGSIGILTAVPMTAAISAYLYSKK